MRYYLIAGERSGDLHGGNLIRALRQIKSDAEFRGFGGDRMQSEGMQLVAHYKEMAFMGIIQVVLNLRKISSWMKRCKADILEWKPDAVILIDYGGFNMRMASFLKTNGIRVVYYISPKVWAWNTGRALTLKRTVDQMLCILPFEKDFFAQFDWQVEYVGNPVLDAVNMFMPDPGFKLRHQIQDADVVALLPGSRKLELKRILPLMAEVVKKFPKLTFMVAAIRELPESLYEPIRHLPNVRFVYDETYNLLSSARAAIVTSGTATLETGLLNVPQVVVYKATELEYAIGSRLVKVDYISLINLIAKAPVVKELLQHHATSDSIGQELEDLLLEGPYRTKMLEGYQRVRSILDIGSASENAARKIVEF